MGERVAPIIVKLGGSVITVKEKPLTSSVDAIDRLAGEVANSGVKPMILIHGGGSFGHPIARAYGIKEGYKGSEQLVGFSKTRQAMGLLNNFVVDALIRHGVSAVAVQPSSCVVTRNGRIFHIELEPIRRLLKLGFVPVLYGDAVLDSKLGFTILSGDQLASSLAILFGSSRIIISVDVDGLYTSDPKSDPCAELLGSTTLWELESLLERIGGAKTTDVTGGMFGKMVELLPALRRKITVIIINAGIPKRLYKALMGEEVVGTVIRSG